MQTVSAVAADYRRIFTIAETTNMNVPVNRFLRKVLTNQGRDQSKSENDKDI